MQISLMNTLVNRSFGMNILMSHLFAHEYLRLVNVHFFLLNLSFPVDSDGKYYMEPNTVACLESLAKVLNQQH